MANLNRELEIWYTRLAKPLQWTPENVRSAPFSFFLLHQQYHVTMILLHRPFAEYDAETAFYPSAAAAAQRPSEASGMMEEDDYTPPQANVHLSSMSRSICTQHAVRVARIFWQHRQRFDTRQIFVTGLQHAGTAAIALVAALASLKDTSSRDANMHYLETLAAALEDMAQTYQPAERMSAVLQAVIIELRATLPQPKQRKVVPARRESTHDHEDRDQDDRDNDGAGGGRFRLPSKRHQSFRATSPPKSFNQQPFTHSQAGQQQQQHQHHPTSPINEVDVAVSLEHPPMEPAPADPTDTQMASHHQSSLDGFVVVTPRAEPVNLEGTWPTLTNSIHSALDYPMFPNGRSVFMSSGNMPGATASMATPQSTSAWMGAETPAVSPPPTTSSTANQHTFLFPSASSSAFATGNSGNNNNNRMQDDPLGNGVSNLDFLSLLASCDRGDFSGLAGRDDDFALLPTPNATPVTAFNAGGGGNKPTPDTNTNTTTNRSTEHRRYGSNTTKLQEGSAARTMAQLDDLWNQMKGSNKTR
jgi:hypothetical protein